MLFYPLVFEPGTSWEYGAGLDWAGKAVERLNNGTSLQEYMELNIFHPLDMNSATFRLSERPELKERVPRMMVRQGLNHPIYGTAMAPSGRLIPAVDEGSGSTTGTASRGKIEELPDDHPDSMSQYKEETDDFGGSGAYCSAPDFAKLLHALCPHPSTTTPSAGYSNSLSTQGAGILSPPMISEMFTPQLSAPSRTRLQCFFSIAEISNIFGHGLPFANMHMDMASGEPLPPLDFGLGGLLVMEDVPGSAPSSLDEAGLQGFDLTAMRLTGRRKRGSMFWSGFPNLYWWMDPASGVSGFYGSQLSPQGDQRSLEWFARWEELVYERVTQGAY
jgi:CubicO group peptidase (beta-lactamase class C family)